MNTSELLLAESHGRNIGRSLGFRTGYDEGWADAVNQCQRIIDRLAKQNRAIETERDELSWAFNSLLAIAGSSVTALEGNDRLKIKMLIEYLKKSEAWNKSGHLRGMPHEDPALVKSTPELTGLVKTWIKASR